MEQIKWMLAGSFVLAVLLVTGCGGPHLDTVRMPLRHGDLDRSTSLIVTPVKVDALSFSGDAAGDAEKTTEARQRIERDLARLIAGELRAAGFNAAQGQDGVGEIFIQVEAQHFDYGSAVARGLVGRGSGMSSLLIRVHITRGLGGETVADFDVRPTSGGAGGWFAMHSYLGNHLEDAAAIIADYLDFVVE